MQLTDQTLNDLNLIAEWLALDQLEENTQIQADFMILTGHAVLPVIEGGLRLARQFDLPVLLSGGIGHATPWLREAVADHPVYRSLETVNKSEAEIMAALGELAAGLSFSRMLLETQSGNSGENASFSRSLLARQKIYPQSIILVQDPLLQRRTLETFRHCWRDAPQPPRFISWPVFVPQVVIEKGIGRITGAPPQGLWPLERFITLLLGEVIRLRDNKTGYGPAGTGFIGHVDIPEQIEAAWQRLMALPGWAQHLAR